MIKGFSDNSVIEFGDTIEEAFKNATTEILQGMDKLLKTSDGTRIDVQAKASSVEQLFLEWLTDVLELCDAENVAPVGFDIRIGNYKNTYFVHGTIHGRKLKEEISNRDSIKSISNAIVEVGEENNQFVVRFSPIVR